MEKLLTDSISRNKKIVFVFFLSRNIYSSLLSLINLIFKRNFTVKIILLTCYSCGRCQSGCQLWCSSLCGCSGKKSGCCCCIR